MQRAMPQKEYYYGLDQLRAILMLIGVLIHTVALISPYYSWNYSSQYYNHSLIHNIVYLSHYFRMETFFVIAGFFSCMVLAKKSKGYFLEGRFKRVFMPLICSMLFINTFEVYFVVVNNIKAWDDIVLGDFIVHSWFLLTLMILSLFCFLPVNKFLDIFNKLPVIIRLGLFVFYLFLPFGIKFVLNQIIPMAENAQFYSIYFYFIEKTLYYSVYFFFGYALYRSEYMRTLLSNRRFNKAVWGMAIICLILSWFRIEHSNENTSLIERSLWLILTHITALSTAWALFSYFFNAKFKSSKISALLVRSAIIIYLFHHPLVIVLGYYLDIDGMTSVSYFLIVTIATYILSFISYFIINSNSVTRFMFGIK